MRQPSCGFQDSSKELKNSKIFVLLLDLTNVDIHDWVEEELNRPIPEEAPDKNNLLPPNQPVEDAIPAISWSFCQTG